MNGLKIATPVSHLFENPEIAEEIRIASDCLECRERNVKLCFSKEYLFHIDIDLTHHWEIDRQDYIRELICMKKDLQLISFQVTSCYSRPTLEKGMFQPGGERLTAAKMLTHATNNVTWLRTFLADDMLIAIENNNYYPTSAYDQVTEGSFLTEIIKETGILFLFDIAHAMVSAHNLKIPYQDYIRELPLSHAVQLHICSPDLTGEIGHDAHNLPDDFLLEETQRLSDLCPIQYLTVEYYKDKDRLLRCLQHLQKMIKKKESTNG